MARNQKRKRGSGVEPENLKRFKVAVHKLTSGPEQNEKKKKASSSTEKTQTAVITPAKALTRKEKRKEGRKLKKMRRNAFQLGKALPTAEGLAKERDDKWRKVQKKRRERVKRKERRERQKEGKMKEQEEEAEKSEKLKAADLYDDKAIKELEKQLHLNKRKKKGTLPQSFHEDGLDYILDAVDSNKLQALYEDGAGLDDEDADLIPSGTHDSGTSSEDGGASSGSEDDEAEDQIMSEDEDLDQFYEDDDDGEDEDLDEEAKKIKIIENIIAKAKQSKSDLKGALKSVLSQKETKDSKKSRKSVKFKEEDMSEEEGSADDSHSDDKDSDSNEDDYNTIENYEDDESDNAEDGNMDISSQENVAKRKSKKLSLKQTLKETNNNFRTSNSGDSESDNGSDGDISDEDVNDMGSNEGNSSDDGDNDDMNDEGDSIEEEESGTLKEDIYGRLRDATGNVVEQKQACYVPPGRRLQMADTMDAKKKLELERMKKQLKGLINRLSEANMQPISSQIEELYRSHSRAYLSESLTSIILDACVSVSLIPDRLIMEQAMLIALLHSNVGSEVGAVFLQNLAQKFDAHYGLSGYGKGKEMDNVLVILAHLYNFKVVHSLLVFDVMKRFSENFGERDIELLLLLLKNVGFTLRKDDPVRLKDVIVEIQTKASNVDTSKFEDPSRVKFMVEVLMAIRNNNMRKIPNYDPSHLEHLKKVLRNYSKGTSEGELRISLEDLLHADEKGRWWLVGSAWTGRETDAGDSATSKTQITLVNNDNVSSKVLELARQQRMNTDIRKNIFCLIMTSEDFVDAFEKLLRLSLKQQPEREIIHVIMDMCMQEKTYNPFYSYLAQKFCEYHRRFVMTLQFNVWDKLKVMEEMPQHNLKNLGRMLAHLISQKALSLSIFKVVEFGELGKSQLIFLRCAITTLLTKSPENVTEEVFMRIAPIPKLANLREGLKLFMRHFLLGKKIKKKGNAELEERVEIAERALNSAQASMLL